MDIRSLLCDTDVPPSRYETYESLCARGERPDLSFGFCHIIWEPFGSMADCIKVAEDPRDEQRGSRPYLQGESEDVIAEQPLTEPPISSVIAGTDDLDHELDAWLDVYQRHAADFDDDPSIVWMPFAEALQTPGFSLLGSERQPDNVFSDEDEDEMVLMECRGQKRPGKAHTITVVATSKPYVTVGDYIRIVHPWLQTQRRKIVEVMNNRELNVYDDTPMIIVFPYSPDSLMMEVGPDEWQWRTDYVRHLEQRKGGPMRLLDA